MGKVWHFPDRERLEICLPSSQNKDPMLYQWGMKQLWVTNGLGCLYFSHSKNSGSWMSVAEPAGEKFHPKPRILLFFHFTMCGFCPQFSPGCKMATTPLGIASKFQAGRSWGGRNSFPIRKAKSFPKSLADFHWVGHVATPATTEP